MVMGGDRENLSSFSLRKIIKEGELWTLTISITGSRDLTFKVPEILVDGKNLRIIGRSNHTLFHALKRTGMSFKNNWIDKEGRVFIYFTVEEIMKEEISNLRQ